MSLFDQLRRLSGRNQFPLEDFHTEIVAQVLRNSHELTLDWLRRVGVTELFGPVDSLEVRTQERLDALPGHDTDSRPDIAIRLRKGDRAELVFIESKLSAEEGSDQLTRYADHLAQKDGFEDFQRKTLLFVTRNFISDQQGRFEKHAQASVFYCQSRWSIFYERLKEHLAGDGLANELRRFMEELNMSSRNQFNSDDRLTLEHFSSARALMDETLWTEVSNEFEKVFGKVSKPRAAIQELLCRNRYVVSVEFGDAFNCALGYFLPNGESTNVYIGVVFGANPKSLVRNKVIATFRGFVRKKNGEWWDLRLDDDKDWGLIGKTESLQSFLARDGDHVKAVKDYFCAILNEINVDFKNTYNDLPWSFSDAAGENE